VEEQFDLLIGLGVLRGCKAMIEKTVDIQNVISLRRDWTCYTASDLRRLFDDSLKVWHISSPLQVCDGESDIAEARNLMEAKHFDRLGVTTNGTIVGYVELRDLKEGKCGDCYKRFDPAELAEHSTPLIDILPLMQHKPALFVLERTAITSIVTKADLQKAPVRMLLFGLITLLEMYLRDMLQVCYPDESFRARLKAERVVSAEKVLLERRQSEEDLLLVDCLQMCDEYAVLVGTDGFREHFQLSSKRSAKSFFGAAEKLRNKLAHAQDLVSGTTWEKVVDIAERINAFLNRYDATHQEFKDRFGHNV
jgi:hypothetical protein